MTGDNGLVRLFSELRLGLSWIFLVELQQNH